MRKTGFFWSGFRRSNSPRPDRRQRNALEMLAESLTFVATTALSVNLTSETMRLIPAATIVFIVVRLAFWIGYRIHPLYRAFGMAATGYLNVGLLAFALWKALAG